MKQQLDPKAVWLFYISFVLRWFIFIIPFVYLAGIFINFDRKFDELLTSGEFGASLLGLLGWLIILILAFLIFAFVWAKLTYYFYRYELTDDGFRKELGVIWKKYVTIPYDRIQNVDIYRGVAARVLGLSDLHIQTAGASAQYSRYGSWGLSAEGRLPGLSREAAEQLRDELVRRAKTSKNQGL